MTDGRSSGQIPGQFLEPEYYRFLPRPPQSPHLIPCWATA